MESTFKFRNLADVLKVFSDESKCLQHLIQMRWNGKPYCPHCGCEKVYAFKSGKLFKCADCRKQFSPKVGTIFEDTKIPLSKWFIAIYLITSHKKGISSLQLSRDLGVTQKTAWFILHRLRHASNTKSFNAPLKNVVEVDETYIGGKEKNKHASKKKKGTQGRNTDTKAPVVALVEREGKVIANFIPKIDSQTVSNYVASNVVFGTNIMTDEYRVYNVLRMMYKHHTVNHSTGEYVNNGVHTNTVEGFFSLLKRGILGIYHFVSVKHLNKYLSEFTFRYNSRDFTEENRFNFLLHNVNGKLTYKQLIEKL